MPVGLHLDGVAGLEPAVELEAGAAGGGAGAEDLTGAQREALGGVGDHVLEGVVHALVLSPPQRSPLIRTLSSTSCGSISSAVTMQGPSTLEPSQSLALQGPIPTGQLADLDVAGGHVVPDRVAEDVVQRRRSR